MTRKVFIKSFTLAIIIGLSIVLNPVFTTSNYPMLKISMYVLISIIMVYIIYKLLKSRVLSYSLCIVSIFTLIISIPIFPFMINGYSDFLIILKPAVVVNTTDDQSNVKPVSMKPVPISQKNYMPEKTFYEKLVAGFKSLKVLVKFPQESEKFFNNHFPLRELIGRTYNGYAISNFKKSSNDKVILGKNGWLFYKGDDSRQTIEDYLGKMSFSKSELEKIRIKLEKFNSDFHKRNIQFLVVIAPNKESIYDELLPDYYFKGKTSRLEQLENYLKNKGSNVKLLDFKEVFFKAKLNPNIKYPLYFRTDTHWNDSGAYIAYVTILKQFNMDPIAEDNFIKEERVISGDIVKTMLNCDGIITESSVFYVPKVKRIAKIIDKNDKDFKTVIEDSNRPKAVFYRDSFSTQIQPFISEHFSRVLWIYNHKINMQLYENEKIDYVVVEIGERYLHRLLSL